MSQKKLDDQFSTEPETEVKRIEELGIEELDKLIESLENGNQQVYLGEPEVYELESGDQILFETEKVEPTEAIFLGTTHGKVRLKGQVPNQAEEELKEYYVGEKAIQILGADRLV